jgi:LysM domain
MIAYTVVQGDCFYSIAATYGFPWKVLWNHPDNAALKQKRKDPNVLLPGDVVMVPEKQQKEVSCATDANHPFQLNAMPAKLVLQMLDRNHKPRKGLKYSVSIDGEVHTGTTDGQGKIDQLIRPDAKKASLVLQDGQDVEKYEVSLGHVNPIDDKTGGQQRLENLGLKGMSPKIALLWFQKKNGLQQSGELDSQTLTKLKSVHGC